MPTIITLINAQKLQGFCASNGCRESFAEYCLSKCSERINMPEDILYCLRDEDLGNLLRMSHAPGGG